MLRGGGEQPVMAMAPWYTPWRYVLGGGLSAELQYELLVRLECLSAQGRADRPGVIEVIEQAERAFGPPADTPVSYPPGSDPPCVEDDIRRALEAARYLDGWARVAHLLQFEPGALVRIIDDVKALHVSNQLLCPRCQQRLPVVARFCGYCGMHLGASEDATRGPCAPNEQPG